MAVGCLVLHVGPVELDSFSFVALVVLVDGLDRVFVLVKAVGFVGIVGIVLLAFTTVIPY